ncbi:MULTISPECIES: DUF805 domain-containing protein [Acinetobacter]|uniref:DUF805 domain-containing protein n=1 Tax=Acinetobacter TaxID=469 RepID=UPI00141ACEF6|nr:MULTISPECIES: DUF805 domain-containing protein [Acinetobacter]MCS4297509.1 uncharacterized membrane protein YhaH (DUF805 family) [Acinetobacter guillouiae]MCW2249810.1 uncharacterized membrane protein YhaH (DUF805 family) [Acinetobacter sp. BIGb0204]NII38914.1 uncharacterized membrane protein YhaH (DUF805 family) [Acinetobacter sp. BIGb0196]
MKGKILDFTIQTNMGIILGNDQIRYSFVGSEWKEQQTPIRGHEVDFEINAEGHATGIYLEFTATPSPVTLAKTPAPSSIASNGNQQNSAKEMFNKLDQTESNYRQAILTCFKKFADFKGRARRSEFWYFELFCVLISLAFSFISEDAATIAMIVTFIPNIAVSVRRLHDIDRSGWWMLIALVPIVGILLLLFWATQEGNPTTNQYGESPKA